MKFFGKFLCLIGLHDAPFESREDGATCKRCGHWSPYGTFIWNLKQRLKGPA